MYQFLALVHLPLDYLRSITMKSSLLQQYVEANQYGYSYLELLIKLVDECLVEVECVLLLADVHCLAPELEYLPEALWHIVLEL